MRTKPVKTDEQTQPARDARMMWEAAQPRRSAGMTPESRKRSADRQNTRASTYSLALFDRQRRRTTVLHSLLSFGAALAVGLFVDAVSSSFFSPVRISATASSSAERARISVLDPNQTDGLEDETENRILRFLAGVDSQAREMSDAEVEAELNDPLATLVLRKGVFPANLDEVLGALNTQNGSPSGVPTQSVYLVGEGSQIQQNQAPPELRRELRFVITRQKGSNVDLMISVGAGAPPTGFVQIISWDNVKNAFNYYERQAPATWVWLGDSAHSLKEGTRGEGCFACHVNGGPVMKELRLPWNNWHSQNATISPSILSPDDQLRTNPLFLEALNGGFGAQDFERFAVGPGIRRWNTARVRRMIAADGAINDLPLLLRQLFSTTTVNLTSSGVQSKSVSSTSSFILPLSFFINRDALFNVLKLNPEVELPKVSGEFYLAAVDQFQLALVDPSIDFRLPGDTFFSFLVPEPSFEDLDALRQLLEKKIITPKFAACVLMIDFQNPVYSEQRQRLSRYIPSGGTIQSGISDVPAQIAERITQAANGLPLDSPEQHFLANWKLPDDQWQNVFRERIRSYLTAVNVRLSTTAGFDAYMLLAVSRRREFKASPAKLLAEFPLLLPESNVASTPPFLHMNSDGGVSAK